MGQKSDIAQQITAKCLMGRTRYLSRVMTGMYDEEVRPFGVQASQVSLLAMIAAHGPVRRSDLGRWLHFDSSTLTRNLRIMLAKSWIEEVADATDGRGLPLQVTAAGTGLLEAIGPAWDRAQSRAADLMGGEGRTAIMGLFDKVRQSVRA